MSYRSAVLADSPLHFWDLQEPSSSTASDYGSTAHNGTYTNAGSITRGVAGPTSGDIASTFKRVAGQDGYVDIPDAADLDIVGDLTLECWASFGSVSVSTVMFDKGGTGSANVPYGFRVNTSGLLEHYYGEAAAARTRQIVSGPTLSINTYYHVAMTRNGTTITFYVNGVSYTASNTYGTAAGANASTAHLGSKVSSAEGDVTMAYAAMWNTALSGAQIAAHYAARLASGKVQSVFVG
jgi:hypothetical protein